MLSTIQYSVWFSQQKNWCCNINLRKPADFCSCIQHLTNISPSQFGMNLYNIYNIYSAQILIHCCVTSTATFYQDVLWDKQKQPPNTQTHSSTYTPTRQDKKQFSNMVSDRVRTLLQEFRAEGLLFSVRPAVLTMWRSAALSCCENEGAANI